MAEDGPVTDHLARPIDFGRTADDYATHRPDLPDRLFTMLEQRGWMPRGARTLDVGTGTGAFARELAARGLTVTGIDRAPAMIEAAKQKSSAQRVTVDFRVGTAERLPFP